MGGGGWVKVGINTNSVELSLVGTELGKILGDIGQYWANIGYTVPWAASYQFHTTIVVALYHGAHPTNSTQLELSHCSMVHVLPIPHN